jgi:hypothetical protein
MDLLVSKICAREYSSSFFLMDNYELDSDDGDMVHVSILSESNPDFKEEMKASYFITLFIHLFFQ